MGIAWAIVYKYGSRLQQQKFSYSHLPTAVSKVKYYSKQAGISRASS
jgi:hypothetical protein